MQADAMCIDSAMLLKVQLKSHLLKYMQTTHCTKGNVTGYQGILQRRKCKEISESTTAVDHCGPKGKSSNTTYVSHVQEEKGDGDR